MSDNNQTQSNDFMALIKKWRLIQQHGNNHDVFKQILGDWDVKLIFHGGGQKWESKCKAKNKLIHGDRFLIENIKGEIFAPDNSGTMKTEAYS